LAAAAGRERGGAGPQAHELQELATIDRLPSKTS
jgi:hypothetical protein